MMCLQLQCLTRTRTHAHPLCHACLITSLPPPPGRYDKVYGPESTQEQIYNDSVDPIVEQVCNGMSCCIFAYVRRCPFPVTQAADIVFPCQAYGNSVPPSFRQP